MNWLQTWTSDAGLEKQNALTWKVSALRCLIPGMLPGADDGSDCHPGGFPFPNSFKLAMRDHY